MGIEPVPRSLSTPRSGVPRTGDHLLCLLFIHFLFSISVFNTTPDPSFLYLDSLFLLSNWSLLENSPTVNPISYSFLFGVSKPPTVYGPSLYHSSSPLTCVFLFRDSLSLSNRVNSVGFPSDHTGVTPFVVPCLRTSIRPFLPSLSSVSRSNRTYSSHVN